MQGKGWGPFKKLPSSEKSISFSCWVDAKIGMKRRDKRHDGSEKFKWCWRTHWCVSHEQLSWTTLMNNNRQQQFKMKQIISGRKTIHFVCRYKDKGRLDHSQPKRMMMKKWKESLFSWTDNNSNNRKLTTKLIQVSQSVKDLFCLRLSIWCFISKLVQLSCVCHLRCVYIFCVSSPFLRECVLSSCLFWRSLSRINTLKDSLFNHTHQ